MRAIHAHVHSLQFGQIAVGNSCDRLSYSFAHNPRDDLVPKPPRTVASRAVPDFVDKRVCAVLSHAVVSPRPLTETASSTHLTCQPRLDRACRILWSLTVQLASSSQEAFLSYSQSFNEWKPIGLDF